MNDEFTLTLNSPITEEQWDVITDVDFEHTNEITFHTKHGKEVTFVKASAQPEIIRCKDCRWWDKCDQENGYCMAAKHGYWSEHWEISIRRTYKGDFYCADAEPNCGVSMQDDFSEHMNPPTT